VLESGEDTDTGGTKSAAGDLKVGDAANDRQYRSILSFATGALPDDAVVVGGMLQVKRHKVVGDPFGSLGDLQADASGSHFGTSAALQAADFSAAPDAWPGAFFDPVVVGGRHAALLTTQATQVVNLAGTTQFRLFFTVDDDDDQKADTLLLYGGGATRANRPKLTLYYYTP
jgi:hypothetical protein